MLSLRAPASAGAKQPRLLQYAWTTRRAKGCFAWPEGQARNDSKMSRHPSAVASYAQLSPGGTRRRRHIFRCPPPRVFYLLLGDELEQHRTAFADLLNAPLDR